MNGPNLQNVHGCLRELEDCSHGIAYLDHLFGRVLDDLAERQATMENVESEAAIAARKDAPSAATAAEIKGLMTKWINERPSKAKAREELREAQRRKDKVDRWMRSLEKRGGFAQSAQNGHEQIARFGGGT